MGITTTRVLLIAMWEHPAQDVNLLLNNPRSQHTHLITTGKLDGDPNMNNPQSHLTHTLYHLARTLKIFSSQHSFTNPRPTITQ